MEAQRELRLRLRRDHVRSGFRVLHLAQSQNSQRSVLSKRTDRLGNLAYDRVVKDDVKYRFVIDMASLKGRLN